MFDVAGEATTDPAVTMPALTGPADDVAMGALLAELEAQFGFAVDPFVSSDEWIDVPADLDGHRPGPELGAVLAAVDPQSTSDFDQVLILRAHQRMVSYHQAAMYRAMVGLLDGYDHLYRADPDPALSHAAAAAEIRAALRMTRRSADHELGVAEDLMRRLPRVWDALHTGHIDRRRAYVFVAGTAHLPERVAREVADRLVDDAPRWTTGQLAERLRRACVDVSPDDAADRYEAAVDDRKVVTQPNPDGTVGLLGLDLPADRAAEATDRINRIARDLRGPDETRSMDQLRADVFLDLLCGTTHHHGHPRAGSVHLAVDLDTLTRLSDHPGELAGMGPVVADLARQLARDLTDTPWTYTVTHPDSGQPVATGTTRRRPTTAQRRAIRARHPVCVFPGCRAPALTADIDHTTPVAEGGDTTADNLAPLCRPDHCTRHQAGWTYQATPDGDHTWTSPLGHTYTTSGRDP